MAGINSAQVYLPSPDQSGTTGAIAVAALGTTAPTSARAALGGSWTTGGYVGEDGLSMSLSRSFTAIKDWSQATVRKALTDFDGTLSFPFMQIDEFAMDEIFGSSNVAATAHTTTTGNQLTAKVGAQLAPRKAWCFSMKDEDRRVRVYCPEAQITEVGDVSFVPGGAHQYPCTLSCYPDTSGYSIYVMYDDGDFVISA